jgi:ADP-ribose pyrophosphatase
VTTSAEPDPTFVTVRKQQFGKWISIESRAVTLPGEAGDVIDVHVVQFPDIALVVPILDEGVLLLRQFRFPTHSWIVELPAGRVESDELPEFTARRELSEESGYLCNFMEKIGELRISPHLSNEVTHVFVAQDLKKGRSHPEKGELVTPLIVPFSDLREEVTSGRLCDAKTISALVLAGLL